MIPDHIDWLVIVNGALSELLKAENFEQFGSVTPEQVADRFEEMFFAFRDSECPPVTPIGAIMMHGSATPPAEWLLCDGSAVSRATYASLFAAIGTAWGVGNGTTTFNLPNFTERSPMGTGGTVATNIGNAAGALTHTLALSEVPAHDHNFAQTPHTHLYTDTGHSHNEFNGASQAFNATGGTGRVGFGAVTTSSTTPVLTGAAAVGITIQNANSNITHNAQGGGGAHQNVHPVRGVPFIIFAGV